jgi:hypothetical protein
MNFISEIDSYESRVELKYCERCGGLFLRLCGASLSYCGTCKVHLTLPSPASRPVEVLAGRRSRNARTPGYRRRASPGTVRIGDLRGVALSEVRPC